MNLELNIFWNLNIICAMEALNSLLQKRPFKFINLKNFYRAKRYKIKVTHSLNIFGSLLDL